MQSLMTILKDIKMTTIQVMYTAYVAESAKFINSEITATIIFSKHTFQRIVKTTPKMRHLL